MRGRKGGFYERGNFTVFYGTLKALFLVFFFLRVRSFYWQHRWTRGFPFPFPPPSKDPFPPSWRFPLTHPRSLCRIPFAECWSAEWLTKHRKNGKEMREKGNFGPWKLWNLWKRGRTVEKNTQEEPGKEKKKKRSWAHFSPFWPRIRIRRASRGQNWIFPGKGEKNGQGNGTDSLFLRFSSLSLLNYLKKTP